MNYIHDSGAIVRVFMSGDDRYHGTSMYGAILNLAREMRLAGATVLHGVEGFGASATIHSERNLPLAEDAPVVVEVVDVQERLERFVDRVETMLGEANAGGLVISEPVDVIRPRPAG
jgi:PII-like signaling protein